MTATSTGPLGNLVLELVHSDQSVVELLDAELVHDEAEVRAKADHLVPFALSIDRSGRAGGTIRGGALEGLLEGTWRLDLRGLRKCDLLSTLRTAEAVSAIQILNSQGIARLLSHWSILSMLGC